MLDVVDRGRKEPLVLKNDPVRHFLRRQPGIGPQDTHNRDIDVGKNIRGGADDGDDAEDQNQNRSDDKCIRPA